MHKYCFVVPTYQHSEPLSQVLAGLARFNSKVFVVNDGSDQHHRLRLESLCRDYDFVELIHHPKNMGKGEACKTGLLAAYQAGFTHGVQIDSDGQHDISKVDELLAVAEKNPGQLISGQPVYDESVPKSRFFGRYVTHFWVWIETLSFQIKDSMCGFRVYPLKETAEIFSRYRVGRGMDFDTEIMVRLFWEGVGSQFVPVPVKYPEGGVSHFHVWRDNLRISKMHTRLFFGMLFRLPKILFSKNRGSKSSWHEIEEVGTTLGMRTLLLLFKIGGYKVLQLALYPVAFYYSLRGVAREASQDYQKHFNSFTGQKKSFSTFQHIYSFAQMVTEKFAVWLGHIKYSDLNKDDVAKLVGIAESKTGAVFITSHYGNIEICRALGRFSSVKFNALVYYENAVRFNRVLTQVNPVSNLNLISVKDVGPALAIRLKENIDNGEWVFIMGDRLSVRDRSRALKVSVLGSEAAVPEGPFTLAYVMDVPVYVIHCFREKNQFRIRLKKLEETLPRGRANREQIIKSMADQYAVELDEMITNDPLQWYNFFKFWSA